MINKRKKAIIWFVVIFLAIIIAVFSIIPFLVMRPMVERHVDFKKVWEASEFGLEENHFFVQTDDGLNISTYEVAVDTPKVVVICLAGIHNPSATAYFGHAKLFKEHHISTFLLDIRAHGESDGDKICLGHKEYLDTKAVVAYIKQQPQYDGVPIVIMGLSMGGATAINSIGKSLKLMG